MTWDWEGSHEPLAAESFCSPSPEREVCVDRWEIYSDSEAVIFVYSHSEVGRVLEWIEWDTHTESVVKKTMTAEQEQY